MSAGKAIAAVILLGGAAAGGYYFYQQSLQPSGADAPISGNVELERVEIAFKTSGRLKEILFREGDRVKKGDVVARLDDESLLRQRDRELAALASATAQLERARSSLELQRRVVSSDIELRDADVRYAEAALRELLSGARPEEIQEARAALAGATAEFEQAQADLERAKKMRQADDITAAQFDQYQLRHDTSKTRQQAAQERLNLVLAGARPDAIEASEAQVQRAKAALRAAQNGQIEITRREQEIRASEAEVARARAQIALIDTQIAEMAAVSPIDGLVMVQSAQTGEVIGPGAVVMTIGDLEHPWVRGYIDETMLGRIKLGGKAEVTTDSFPGKKYEGTISYISPEAEFTPKQIQTPAERIKLVYRIKIDVANPNQELKLNMPVDVRLVW